MMNIVELDVVDHKGGVGIVKDSVVALLAFAIATKGNATFLPRTLTIILIMVRRGTDRATIYAF